ncbi:hypothetical protein AVEN_106345-1 [Araneus ventricosus]|uniref:Uncharacterized protein n=1 Tax=Araneus ventricosus TaxID=182803 RepID=A0A4Y2ASX4_ARAVE|nr:hypothetical protein AVEN_106345-1 [Araneus ventricosus]
MCPIKGLGEKRVENFSALTNLKKTLTRTPSSLGGKLGLTSYDRKTRLYRILDNFGDCSSCNRLMYIARRGNGRNDTEVRKTSPSAPNATLTFIRFPRLMMLRVQGYWKLERVREIRQNSAKPIKSPSAPFKKAGQFRPDGSINKVFS